MTAKFPAYRDDFVESYRSLIFEKGISSNRIFLGGDSAGGLSQEYVNHQLRTDVI